MYYTGGWGNQGQLRKDKLDNKLGLNTHEAFHQDKQLFKSTDNIFQGQVSHRILEKILSGLRREPRVS